MRRFLPAAALSLLLATPALASEGLPDLQIENLQVPQPVRAGEEVRLDLQVVNRGLAPTGGARVCLRVDGKTVGTWRLREHLPPGSREKVQLRWTPDREGTARLAVEVDPDRAIPEAEEANNLQETSVEVAAGLQVDLELVELVAPQPLRQGSAGEILVRVANPGDAPAWSVHVRLLRDGQPVAERTVRGELPPKATRSIPLSWIPKESGDAELVATVDLGARSSEASSDNNTLRATFPVLPRAAVNLQALRLEAPELRVGREALVQAVVRNDGDLPAFGCKVTLLVDGVPVAMGNSQSGLEAGDEVRVPLRWTPDRPGTARLEMEVEARASGQERATDDNRAALEVQVSERKER